LGTDLTQIPGISEVSAMEIISESGIEMGRWPTENHFTSWLGIVSNTKKSGGKIISNKIMKKSIALVKPCEWQPAQCTTVNPHWVISLGGSKSKEGRQKLSWPQQPNWPLSCTT